MTMTGAASGPKVSTWKIESRKHEARKLVDLVRRLARGPVRRWIEAAAE
jgi:hypothetical protein